MSDILGRNVQIAEITIKEYNFQTNKKKMTLKKEKKRYNQSLPKKSRIEKSWDRHKAQINPYTVVIIMYVKGQK